MASKQKYECFRCRDNGYPNSMVYLAGKDDQGKTVYVEEDGRPHLHKLKQQQQEQQSQASTTVVTEPTSIKIINAKLDRIISLLESQARQQ